ncbi:uncharacterized protein LOC126784963 [Argentina anserina]|uniref:uncharacterized protein LOC126784963 n=1 Tax=Argentina anserina TaxID=57926 RepID=UPI0021767FA1|nr:uncharacterized protein LOC126784963 [Potentilla anserina]
MGSLMPGWDSPVLKSKSDINKRSHSLTNEEIEAFWKSLKKLDEKEQHIIDDDTTCEEKTATVNKSGKKYEKSSSLPMARTSTDQGGQKKYFMHGETETMASTADKLSADNIAWWTTSNWAFLNELPTIEEPVHGTSKRYATQFHVANSSGGSDEISA